MAVQRATVTARRRLGYCKDAVVSRRPNSLDSKRPTIAASAVPASSSNQLLQASTSRASIRLLSPDVGRFTSTLDSRQGYLSPESTSRNSGMVTPEPTGDFLSALLIRLVGAEPPQENVAPVHQSQTNLPHNQIAFPMDPTGISRYERHCPISRDNKITAIQPLTIVFPHFQEPGVSNQGDLDGWMSATHPEGALYFYDQKRRLFTDTDMCDETLRDEAERFYSHLQTLPGASELASSVGEYDLVLDIKPDHTGFKWCYYYVSHSNRCLFWLQEYPIANMDMIQNVGVQSLAHIKHQLEYLYWSHWSLFPVNFEQRKLSEGIYDELLGMLIHGCVDVMTSKTSTLWLDDDQMQKMIRLIQGAKVASAGDEYYTAGTARLLSFFSHWRFLDFHGQINARLKRNEAIYDEQSREKSVLIIVLSPLLFLAPQRYLAELEEAWIDKHILEPVWKSLMTKMLGEWSDLILWSTVMLSVNVGFLAIPGVVPTNNNTKLPPTPSQIISYLSLIASVGSIVVGLLLVRHHRTKQEEDPNGVVKYLLQNHHKHVGLEPMAIVFSLPWALLMWAMMLFSVELLISCFWHTDLQFYLPIGLMATFVAAPITWCIWNSWRVELDTELDTEI
ncbi:hypothetical protein V8E53_011150 [Lactarius tabidus]